MLLTTDWHLTDSPQDEYRWAIFDRVAEELRARPTDTLFFLGDLADKKDKHSSVLVNRMTSCWAKLLESFPDLSVYALMGNHDMPLHGPPFWAFLEQMGIGVITSPAEITPELIALPYTENPRETWKSLRLSQYKAAFIHQTVSGAVVESGVTMQNDRMVLFPRGLKVYSGDIHVPQVVGVVTYVGAPHPIDFNDSYACRMLRLAPDFTIAGEIRVNSIKKVVLEASSIEELDAYSEDEWLREGDQVRIKLHLDLASIDEWPALQERAAAWARGQKVALASVEITTTEVRGSTGGDRQEAAATSPKETLRLFAEAENIQGDLYEYGDRLLNSYIPEAA